MPDIRISGLGSGLDTQRIVSELVAAYRAPIRRLERRVADYNQQITLLDDINTRLGTLRTRAQGLDSLGEFLRHSATSTDEDVVTASATGEASPGTYDVVVGQLATAQRTYSDAFDSDTDTGLFGTGTIAIQTGDDSRYDITVDATSTLRSVADAINASGAPVNASVFYDGNVYRLQVSGRSTGAENRIVFNEAGTSLGLDDAANTVVEARDAVATIDGFVVQRPGNRIDDALAGVTIDLNQVAAGADPTAAQPSIWRSNQTYSLADTIRQGTMTITVGADDPVTVTIDGTNNTIDGIIDAINASDADARAYRIESGANYRLWIVANRSGTNNDMTVSVSVSGSGSALTVSEEQNASDADLDGGTAETVNVALDPAAVREAVQGFITDYNAAVSRISEQFDYSGTVRGENTLFGDSTLRGILRRLQDVITREVSGLSGDYTALARVGISTNRDGTLALDAEDFDAALNDDPRAVARLFIDDTGAGTEGVAEQLDDIIDDWTDSLEGVLPDRREGIQDRIDDMQEQIERLEARADAYRRTLEAQFASLESLMAQLNSQQGFLTNWIAQLNKSS